MIKNFWVVGLRSIAKPLLLNRRRARSACVLRGRAGRSMGTRYGEYSCSCRCHGIRVISGALFGHCSSCGFSSSFASLGRVYEFERSPLCAGTGDDPKGHAGD